MAEGRDIAAEVKRIIEAQLGNRGKEITLESRFVEDLSADSLDLHDLVTAFEDAFNIHIPKDGEAKLSTVKDAIDYVEDQIKRQAR